MSSEDYRTSRRVRTSRQRRFIVPLVGVLASAGLLFITLRGADEGEGEADEGRRRDQTHDERLGEDAFRRAGEVLRTRGSFAYRGTMDNGALVLGEVVLLDRLHEIRIETGGGASEVVVGDTAAWVRSAPSEAKLDAAVFESVPLEDLDMAALSLTDLLKDARVLRSAGVDWLGQTVFSALLDDPAEGTEIRLTVDGAAMPTRIEVIPGPDQPSAAMRVQLARIGELMSVQKGDLMGDWVTATRSQIEAAGISDPVALGDLPAGWVLEEATLLAGPGDSNCSVLTLTYGTGALSPGPMLRLYAHPASCGPFRMRTGLPVMAGSFSGTASRDGSETRLRLTDGNIELAALTSLPVDDIVPVLESLAPFDA